VGKRDSFFCTFYLTSLFFFISFIIEVMEKKKQYFKPLSPELAQLALKMLLVEHSIMRSDRQKKPEHPDDDAAPDSKSEVVQATPIPSSLHSRVPPGAHASEGTTFCKLPPPPLAPPSPLAPPHPVAPRISSQSQGSPEGSNLSAHKLPAKAMTMMKTTKIPMVQADQMSLSSSVATKGKSDLVPMET
jgi:hypothetical protein